MSTIIEEEYQHRVNKFLEAHKQDYTKLESDFIRSNAIYSLEHNDGFYIYDIVRQVLTELNLLGDDKNMYLGFVKLLEEKFGLEKNIVEVAGGIVPSLSKLIALKQKTGKITIYDPRAIIPPQSPNNLVVKRQCFNKNTQIPDAKMIIGFMPCNATLDIIESACKNEIDFMVALCEGGERPGYGYIETDEEWIGVAKYVAERGMRGTAMGTLEVSSLEKYGNPYPVIYNKRKES